MGVPVPFPTGFTLLVLALPGVWLLGRALAHAITRERAARPALGAGIALSLWVLAVHASSLALHSLRKGLPTATVLLAVSGIAAELLRRRHADRLRPEGPRASGWLLLTAITATCVMAPVALGYHLHDELFLTGHMSIAAQLQNGVYPPRHLAFPDTPLRYHYGFDMVTASLTALFRLTVDSGIDAATLGGFALAWALFWSLGERIAGRAAAFLTSLCALAGGGITIACANHPPMFLRRIVDMCQVGTHYVNPPVSSYFFQHPWSLGIPIGVTALLVFTSRGSPNERVRLVVLAAILAALSMSQMTLFVAFLPAFVVAEAWTPDGLDLRAGLRMLAVAVTAAVSAKLLGGFLVSVPGLPGLRFTLHPGFADTLSGTLVWNAQNFSILLPLAIAGFFTMGRERVLFALLAAGSIVVVNTIRYEGSDDILKFATLGTLSLAVMSSAALARWMPQRRSTKPFSPARMTAAVAMTLVAVNSGALFTGAMVMGWSGIPRWMRIAPAAVAPDDARAITWLRKRIQAGEIVYRNADHTYAYAQWGGFPQPWIQWTAKAFGFSDARISARERLNRGAPADIEVYRREGYRYFVLDASDSDKPLRKTARKWIKDGEAKRVGEMGAIVIVDIAKE